ncbi:zinc finger protein 354A-like [Neodiprion pinetum]|uniref:Zinc finger protein 436-like n=1 Tax=Neodiprion lecontei TaxID=441921 RepID=A0A6J0B7N3_NEOLC|nr:zinc finger protein 436-like [Neodiprion lecontei]XP_046469508.1 zinc finger protein 436-like [Neodiprion pinetum]
MEPTSELLCLLCTARLELTTCVNIFYTSLPRNGMQLVSFILQVLNCIESDLRSSHVCSQCYHMFQILEQAQWTVANIRTEILKVYESSSKQSDSKTVRSDVASLFEIGDKCLAGNLNQANKFKTSSSPNQVKTLSVLQKLSNDECSISQYDLANGCKESLIHSGEVLDLDKKFGQCGAKICTKSININVRSEQNVKAKRKSQLKGAVANVVRHVNSFDNILNDETAGETKKKEQNVNCLSRNEITFNLNRQEKMALYTHRCKVCGRLFKYANDLCLHSLKHGESKPYKCKICNKVFSSISDANTHVVKEHPRNKDAIDIVHELLESNNDDHGIFPEELLGMSDNEEQDDFEWKEVVRNTEKIYEHEHDISKNNSVDMLDVPKELAPNSQEITYKSHRISKYSLKPLKYPCPTCGKKWRTSAELKTHMKSHSSLRPYMCEKCGQAYKHKHALEIHVGMHNGINPFQCSFCNKCFTQKGALMRHLPMHTGETPYQCELCGKRFVHHTSYNMHALSHTGKKSYQCHVCDMSLLSTSHLKRHMRVHTGEKPFSCTLCGKRFAERYNLFAHQKIHDPAEILAKETNKMQYKCKQCALLFDKKQTLDDHLRHHHHEVTDGTSNRKWVGNENDIGTATSKLFTSQMENEIENTIKVDVYDNRILDEAWQQVNYTKLQNIDSDPKLPQSQSNFQVGPNPLAIVSENHKMLIDIGCNRNVITNMGVPSGNQI